MSYLQEDGVHFLSSVLRIGQPNSHIDNFHEGGMVYGIRNDGFLKEKGYTKYGEFILKRILMLFIKWLKAYTLEFPILKLFLGM
ncbi:hypothetical protein DFQ11_102117 [Winogradskyella epiphytica]|uniref:Uncharacterized protein n=1 Tax=Winogradskyella epiphytica TaxID=262005 RepID=A0A2V4XIT4_9FLAO|nr:hypothetical protein DFQ11_102117 [Winogradskyella epiphytica]GGW64406.1 hypothetical protein GCM10008085_15500 [Winogradskyella epiphytica]